LIRIILRMRQDVKHPVVSSARLDTEYEFYSTFKFSDWIVT